MTSKIKVDNINKVSDDSNIIKKCGTTITLGASGDSIALASGASQTGFGRSGSVNWQTTPKTATFTAADGEGYFINQSSGITANLPAGSAGAIVAFSDYARNFATYNFTISPNGSEKIGGVADDLTLDVNGQALTLIYVDSTKGWVNVQNAEDTETSASFITATGGTITTVDTNFKVHTFTGPGSFCVSAGGGDLATVDYLVIAGGGGGSSGTYAGGGGGAGGYRESHSDLVSGPYTASPLATPTGIVMLAGSYPITVGGGAATRPPIGVGNAGNNSVATLTTTITSTGGGGGGFPNGATSTNSGTGGSGGGSAGYNGPFAGGAGNTPPVSPPQGNNGGGIGTYGGSSTKGGGGGGAGAVGENAGPGPSNAAGRGGDGVTTSITGSAVTRGGGGGGSTDTGSTASRPGGSGGGGAGANGPGNSAGTTNTGGGGGGTKSGTSGAAGGSGIVVIRYKFQ